MLNNKTCVVTGGGSGMGRATAIEMAARGANVVVADVNEENGRQTVASITANNGTALFVHCDLRNSQHIRTLMDTAATHFGSIDVLHNNAGIHETDFTAKTAIQDLEEDMWDLICDVNLKAVWLCTKYATPYLQQSKGAIVNAASVGSFVGYPMAAVYCATKGGVDLLTKATAIDLAPYGIRCNCYSPGSIDTPMVSKYIAAAEDKDAIHRTLTGAQLIPRLGKPEEIAKLVCFLASEESSFINGANYLIDGGALAWRGTNA